METKNYVVGLISFFDNEMKLIPTKATAEVPALCKVLKDEWSLSEEEFQEIVNNCKTIEDVQSYVFNCDGAIQIIPV